MRSLTRRLSRTWSSYKYRFVPWIALNLNEKTAVKVEQSDIYSQEELVESLVITLSALEQYTSLREDLTLYDYLHVANQVSLLNEVGFSVSRRQSSIPGAGTGVFIQRGAVNKGSLVCLYPGTVYQPYQPILIQSVGNQFLFRCADGVILDGNHSLLASAIFRSCAGRDQVGLCRVADTSWLTPRPVNPINVGQFVNNGSSLRPANVCYAEIDLPPTFNLRLRKFVPNVNFASVSEDGERSLKVVALVALRRITEGEELFSSYFTIINKS